MKITGTIINRENLPINGATIEEVETGNIAISDQNGHFTLDVQNLNSTLEVRHISYKTKYVISFYYFFIIFWISLYLLVLIIYFLDFKYNSTPLPFLVL